MTSKPPPVPSKNALRALRHLAYSSPTVFIGAVGSICGLTILNHEARQRVKLAEEVVRTKRTLQSVSNGRGQAHIARMCEAAERGEDFTLRTDAASKRRRAKRHSTIPLDEYILGEEDVTTLRQSLQHLSQQRRSKLQDTDRAKSESNARAGAMETRLPTAQAVDRPRRPPLEYRQLSNHSVKKYNLHNESLIIEPPASTVRHHQPTKRNTASAERIRTATLMPMRRESHQVYARQTRQYTTESRRRVSFATIPRLSPAQASAEHEEIRDDHPDILTAPEDCPETFMTSSEFPDRLTPDRRYVDRRERTQVHKDEAPLPEYPDALETLKEDNRDPFIGSSYQHTFSEAVMHEVPIGDSPPSGEQLGEGMVPETALNTDVSFTPLAGLGIESNMTNKFGDEPFYDWPVSAVSDETVVRDTQHNEKSLSLDIDTEQVPDGHHRQSFLKQSTEVHHDFDTSNHAQRIEHLLPSDLKSNTDKAAEAPMIRQTTIPRYIWEVIRVAEMQLYDFFVESGYDQATARVEVSRRQGALCRDLDRDEAQIILNEVTGNTSPFAAQDAMIRCLDTKTTFGTKMAELLYYHISERRLWVDDLSRKRLAAELLKKEYTAARADFILFPVVHDKGGKVRARQSSQLPHLRLAQYLSWFCNNNADPATWIGECRKIVALAQTRGVVVQDRTIAPVLRHLVQVGQRHWAQQLLYDFQNTRSLESSFVSYKIILASHAAAGDWTSVSRMLEAVHSQGLSRTRATGFSILFQQVLEEFVKQKSLDETYGYMMYATGNMGLIPISIVSMTLITACLQQSRFDLIQDWIEYVLQHFPRVETGTSTDYSAWRVAQVWKQREASCEEIEIGCRAMGYAAVQDPFSISFRSILMEAIERDLRTRLQQAGEIWLRSGNTEIGKSLATMRLSEMIAFIKKFVTSDTYARRLSFRHRERFQDILRQIKAITRLNRLMMGELPTEKFPNPEIGSAQVAKSTTSDLTEDGALAMPENARSGPLPRRLRLWRIVDDYYCARQERGLKPSHAILESLIPRMRRYDRRPEALELLEAVYESQHVQSLDGTSFSPQIFSVWLHIALELKNAGEIGHVLWRMIDSRLEMGSDLLVLVRMAKIEVSCNKHLHQSERAAVIEENEYLEQKLQSIHWIQRGARVKAEQHQFQNYVPWPERIRREPMIGERKRIS